MPPPATLHGLPVAPGAYLLIVDLCRPLRLDLPRLARPRLPAGRYAYCGSAKGPGGLRARLARHLRRDKALRWHVDRLTAAGRVAALAALPEGEECVLRAALQAEPGVTAPVPGFGSSDCRRCPSHLLALPPAFDLDSWLARCVRPESPNALETLTFTC